LTDVGRAAIFQVVSEASSGEKLKRSCNPYLGKNH